MIKKTNHQTKPKRRRLGSLSEKEFRIMIVKMIQNLEKKKKWTYR